MKRFLSLFVVLAVFAGAYCMETGKISENPFSSKQSLQLKSGIKVCAKYAAPFFSSSSAATDLDYPAFSMAFHNGKLVAGFGEDGTIMEIDGRRVIARFSEGELIYSLLSLDDRTLLASIEPSGAIVRITDKKTDTLASGDGRATLLKKTGGEVYAAVGNELLIYTSGRFEKVMKVSDRNILFFEQRGGYVYLATEGKGMIIEYSIKDKSQRVVYSMQSGEVLSFDFHEDEIAAVANSSVQAGEGMENFSGLLLRIGSTADTIAKEDFPFSTAVPALGGILITASVPGRCFFYDFADYSYLGSCDHDFIMASLGSKDGAYVSTAQSNSIIRIAGKAGDRSFVSSVIDPLKSIRATAFYPKAKNNGKLYVRTGDTYSVDSTWTEFMPVKPQMNESMNEARYIQYRYLFSGEDDALYGLDIYYKTVNHEPSVKSVRAYPERIIPDYANSAEWEGFVLTKRSFYPELKDNSLFKSTRNVRFFCWDASDKDMDRLFFGIYLVSGQNKYLVKKSFQDAYSVVNLESFAEGWYKARVEASDSADNLEALIGWGESEEFFIDRTQPSFTDDSYEKSLLTFTLTDKSSFIGEVMYSVNGSPYEEVLPLDGVCDSKSEKFRVKIEKKKDEALSIVVKGFDASGNQAVLSKAVK